MTTIDAYSAVVASWKLPVKRGDVTPVLPAISKIPREIGPYSNYPREKRLIRLYQQEFHSVETLVSTILPYVRSRGDVKRILAGLSRAREELSITAGRFYMGGMTIPRDFLGVEEALHRSKRLAGEVLRLAGLEVLAGEWETRNATMCGVGGKRREMAGKGVDGGREGFVERRLKGSGFKESLMESGFKERSIDGHLKEKSIDSHLIKDKSIENSHHIKETSIDNHLIKETSIENRHLKENPIDSHPIKENPIENSHHMKDTPIENHLIKNNPIDSHHNHINQPINQSHSIPSPNHIVFSLQHTLDLSLYETDDHFTLLFFNPFSHSLQLPLIIPLASFLCPVSPRETPLFYVSRQRPDRIIQLFLPMKLPPMTTIRVYLMPCNNQTDFWKRHKMPQFSKTPRITKNELIFGNSTTGVSLSKNGRIRKFFVQGQVIDNPPILGYYRGSTIRACRSG